MGDEQPEPSLPETDGDGRWRTVLFETNEVHVYPLEDLIEHEMDGDKCVCGVQSELLEGDPEADPDSDDPDIWLFSHHSLDGREQDE